MFSGHPVVTYLTQYFAGILLWRHLFDALLLSMFNMPANAGDQTAGNEIKTPVNALLHFLL